MTRVAIPAAVAALVACTAPVSAASSPDAPTPNRGDIVSVTKVGDMSVREVAGYLKRAGWKSSQARYGIDAYRIIYRTVDVDGKRTRASGLVVLPDSPRHRLRLVSYTHGTTSYKPDVASTFDDDFVVSPGLSFGSAGYATAMPDYLGLGKGPGAHPWMHVPSETTASIDMLRATRQLVTRKGRTLHNRVHLTGFSQGASAALGTARRLERVHHRWFRVGAIAPISGAYDLEDVEMPAMRRGDLDTKMSVAYASYLLVAWDRIYDLYDSPAELFKPPYANRVERLFDGTTPGPEMLKALPNDLDGLLTIRGHRFITHPPVRFRRGLSIADSVCKNWRPRQPLRLFAAHGDEQAATGNTFSCARSLRGSGAEAPIRLLRETDFNGSRHLGTNIAGTAATLRWFQRLDAHDRRRTRSVDRRAPAQ